MSASSFSTPSEISLQRNILKDDETLKIEDIWTKNNREKCIEWVKKTAYKRTCLQFPDSYLPHSTKICEDLKNASPDTNFFILADTSYGSCCVDEIAAAHVESDSLIHFGNACQSKVTRLPVFYCFPELFLDLDDMIAQLKAIEMQNQMMIIYFGLEYQHIILNNNEELQEKINIHFGNDHHIKIEKYNIKKELVKDDGDYVCVYIGHDSQNFFNLSITNKASKWFIYDPSIKTLSETNPLTTNYIRRRYFYIEKCKDAQTIGLVVATLTANGYLDVVKHFQEMARARGIRTHIISVGRINPAKLANFMEIDCFILIGCPFNNLYISKEFYKPIVSVFEAEIALNPAWHMKFPETYSTDFKDILTDGKFYNKFKVGDFIENDISLVTGKIRNSGAKHEISSENCSSDSALQRKNHQIIEINNGRVFEDRSWKGLDPALGDNEPVKITKGLSGIPTKYSHD